MGPQRASTAAHSWLARQHHQPTAVAVMGFGGGLVAGQRPGDIVVSAEIRQGDRVTHCPQSTVLVGRLLNAGCRAQSGPVMSAEHIVLNSERAQLAKTGAIAVDMESAAIAEVFPFAPVIALRAIVDVPGHRWASVRTLSAVTAALRALHRAAPFVGDWVDSVRH